MVWLPETAEATWVLSPAATTLVFSLLVTAWLMASATLFAVANSSPFLSAETVPPFTLKLALLTLNAMSPFLFSAVVPVPLTKFSVELA